MVCMWEDGYLQDGEPSIKYETAEEITDEPNRARSNPSDGVDG